MYLTIHIHDHRALICVPCIYVTIMHSCDYHDWHSTDFQGFGYLCIGFSFGYLTHVTTMYSCDYHAPM